MAVTNLIIDPSQGVGFTGDRTGKYRGLLASVPSNWPLLWSLVPFGNCRGPFGHAFGFCLHARWRGATRKHNLSCNLAGGAPTGAETEISNPLNLTQFVLP